MIAATGLRWILTLLFCVLAVYGLWRAFAARSHSWAARLAHGLHAVMALAMFAMAWFWGMDLPASPQVIFFSAAAVWFVVAALALPTGPEPRGRSLMRRAAARSDDRRDGMDGRRDVVRHVHGGGWRRSGA